MAEDPRADVEHAVLITADVVTISVGAKAATLVVHEQIIRSRSHFFRAALDKSWQEARERRVNLPDDELDIVRLYCQFLYDGKIYLKHTVSKTQILDNETISEYLVLAKLYVYGEKIHDALFKNKVIDAFLGRISEPIEGTTYHPIAQSVNIIYESTMSGSLGRRFMVDIHVWHGGPHWVTHEAAENNKDFLMDLARAFMKVPRPVMDATAVRASNYHEGEKGCAKRQRTK